MFNYHRRELKALSMGKHAMAGWANWVGLDWVRTTFFWEQK